MGEFWPHFHSRNNAVAELGIEREVAWFEGLNAEEVPLVVAGATALLLPSRYEGFGLPILEAMASGIPGVCSDATCLPEISAGIWESSGTDDQEAFGAALDRLVFDSESRQVCIQAGLEYAARFTWERCAEGTADFLHSCVA